MRSYKVSVTSQRVLLVAPDDVHRTIYIHHDDDQRIVHIGNDTVTIDTGFHLHKLETISIEVPFKESLYAIKEVAGAAVDVWVLLPDGD